MADVIEADHGFAMLMGDEVELRREFMETHALRAVNIDVSGVVVSGWPASACWPECRA